MLLKSEFQKGCLGTFFINGIPRLEVTILEWKDLPRREKRKLALVCPDLMISPIILSSYLVLFTIRGNIHQMMFMSLVLLLMRLTRISLFGWLFGTFFIFHIFGK